MMAEEFWCLVQDGIRIDSAAWQTNPFIVDGRATNVADIDLLDIDPPDDLLEMNRGPVHGELGSRKGCMTGLLPLLLRLFTSKTESAII
jgi:hypothetical protein